MRLACTVEYEGTPYHGFQNQTDLPTVQGHIEQAFRKISVEPHSFNYSGRTDAGVHALSQVFDFETSIQRSKDEWIRGLNSNLPKTIAIKNIQEVADDFHSRFSALERYYSYVIYNSKNKPTFFDNFVYWDNTTLDIDKIHQASQDLVGQHDFSSFRSSSCGSKNPVKEVKAIALIENGPFLILNISATAFLHNMVRIIAGTLVGMSKGEVDITIPELLAAKDRNLAGKTLTAKGLFFLGPRYHSEVAIKSPSQDIISRFNI
ncbi:tRNA pseudouridine(38-40) synthase TruA [Gammaproteobacteria bacterium]|nr:tRNA pseudouridine(38-40) synthase TruA [Gammaproteobacteria bacterium]